jgi:hypothetical protein
VERRRECLVYSNHSGLEAARTSMAANKSEEERREHGIIAVKAKVVVQTEFIVMLQTREPDIIIITRKAREKGILRFIVTILVIVGCGRNGIE